MNLLACECWCCDICSQAFGICLIIILAGGVGGVSEGYIRQLFNLDPNIKGRKQVPVYFLAGVTSAFGVMILCKCLGLVFGPDASSLKWVNIVGVSFLSGVFSMRLLKYFGNALERKVADLTNDICEEKKKSLETAKIIDEGREYADVTAKALTALLPSEKNWMDVEDATKYVKEAIVKYPLDRRLNIFYGRLLKIRKEYERAVESLKGFICRLRNASQGREFNEQENKAAAAACFNIACYLCLKGSENGDFDSVKPEVARYLREAFEYDSRYRSVWAKDPDLKMLAETDPKFS